VGVIAGLGERMGVWGTLGQIAGVAGIGALALVWMATTTAGHVDSALSPVRVMLFPAWMAGVFAQAFARVSAAIVHALSAPSDATDDEPGAATKEERPDD
jgi:hypothetical protein